MRPRVRARVPRRHRRRRAHRTARKRKHGLATSACGRPSHAQPSIHGPAHAWRLRPRPATQSQLLPTAARPLARATQISAWGRDELGSRAGGARARGAGARAPTAFDVCGDGREAFGVRAGEQAGGGQGQVASRVQACSTPPARVDAADRRGRMSLKAHASHTVAGTACRDARLRGAALAWTGRHLRAAGGSRRAARPRRWQNTPLLVLRSPGAARARRRGLPFAGRLDGSAPLGARRLGGSRWCRAREPAHTGSA